MRGRAGRRILTTVLAIVALGAAPAFAEIHVSLDRDHVAVGEAAVLTITVLDPKGSVGDPSFDVAPRGVDVQSRGTERSMSWVNGRSSNQISFGYEITPHAAGRFVISNLRVVVGRETWTGEPLTLIAEAGITPAALRMEVIPAQPYAGQPVILRLRLIEHQPLEDWTPYEPENLTGFWSEAESKPVTSRVTPESPLRVVETRRRLYPLAAGTVTIGSANAMLTLAEPPQGGFRFSGPRQVSLESGPLVVRVRPLPPGAPADWGGAVGSLAPSWTSDRDRTAADVPVTLTLELRGIANLPLLHAPPLRPAGWEVLPGGVEDSLAAPGTDGPALRRFHWTLVPRRQGSLPIALPDVTWFDPASGSYKRVSFDPIVVEVGPPAGVGGHDETAYPAVFGATPYDPMAHGFRPWAAALAGLALGSMIVQARRARTRDPRDEVRRTRDTWLATLERPGGDFWGAASEISAWLEARGRPQPEVHAAIARARYGNERTEAQPVRTRLRAELEAVAASGARRIPPAAVAAMLALVAVGAGALAWPSGSDSGAVAFARTADDRGRAGDVAAARSIWMGLWNRGARAPGLAARLGWSELRAGDAGRAAAWVLRGAPGEARDPALEWTWQRVRESGGLLGTHPPRPALRTLELAIAGFVLAFAGALTIARRGVSAGLLVLAAAAALALPFRSLTWSRETRGVVLESVTLGDQNLELEPGQAVVVLERATDRLRVGVGHEGSGWLPSTAVEVIR